MCINTVLSGMEKREPDFSVVPADGTGGNAYMLKTRQYIRQILHF